MKTKAQAGQPAPRVAPATGETAILPPANSAAGTAGPAPPAPPPEPTEREAIEVWENEGDPN